MRKSGRGSDRSEALKRSIAETRVFALASNTPQTEESNNVERMRTRLEGSRWAPRQLQRPVKSGSGIRFTTETGLHQPQARALLVPRCRQRAPAASDQYRVYCGAETAEPSRASQVTARSQHPTVQKCWFHIPSSMRGSRRPTLRRLLETFAVVAVHLPYLSGSSC